jgi:hypothetical protein
MAVTVTIGGVGKSIKAGSLRINPVANGRSTASFTVDSTDGSYRPAHDATVVIANGATTLFGGLLEQPIERGLVGGKGVDAISTKVSAVDFHAYAERRFVNETLAAGTLKSMLTTLVNTYLDDYGVTLHGSQVNGPSLPAVTYVYRKLTDVLNELMALTADFGEVYVWKIDASKVLRAAQPSTNAAPFNLVGDTLSQVVGDLTVDVSRQDYANRIILRVPAKTEVEREETFTGDGAEDTFTLQYTPFKTYGYITSDTIFETLRYPDDPDAATWTFDGTRTFTRTSPPGVGDVVIIKFDGTYEGTAIAEDAAEITAHGIWERVVTVESVPDDTTAQQLADSYLAKALYATKTVKFDTREDGLAVGQSMTITVPRRNIDETAVITEIVTREHDNATLIHSVTAIADSAQTNLDRGWRDVYKVWAGDKQGGAGVAISAGTGAPTSAGPGLPFTSNQFNESGVFGGDDEWTYSTAAKTPMVGLLHEPGAGYSNMLIGEGHTVN